MNTTHSHHQNCTLIAWKSLNLCILLLLSISMSYAQQSNPYILEISNLHIIETKKNNVLVSFDVFNAGEEDIDLPYQTKPEDIEIKYDVPSSSATLKGYQFLINEKLAKEDLHLAVGAAKADMRYKLPLQKKEVYRESPIVETKILTIDTLSQKIEEQYVDIDKWITADTTLLFFEDLTIMDTIFAKSNVTPSPAIPACIDLIIDSIWIVQQSKKTVTLRFSIRNIGNKDCEVWGDTPILADNLSIKAYLSSQPYYVNSAYMLRGLFISDEANEAHGILQSQHKITAEMELSLKAKSKFTPYILLEINALHNIEECNSSNQNNYTAILLNQ